MIYIGDKLPKIHLSADRGAKKDTTIEQMNLKQKRRERPKLSTIMATPGAMNIQQDCGISMTQEMEDEERIRDPRKILKDLNVRHGSQDLGQPQVLHQGNIDNARHL